MAWKVTRFCCTSGMCLECRAFLVPGKARKRVLQMGGLTQAKAELVAKNWSSYGAQAEEETNGTEG